MAITVIGKDIGLHFSRALFTQVEQQFGLEGRQRVEKWQRLLDAARVAEDQQKLRAVNNFINQRRFISDSELWQRQDYWATPIEFVAIDGGDCEDFTIAKYVSLRALGIPEDKLRLMYVNALSIGQAHMVLAYYPTAHAVPLVLDNLVDEVLPANLRPDLIPVYSFNGNGLWLAKAQGRGRQVQGSGNVKMWEDLARRIESEIHYNKTLRN